MTTWVTEVGSSPTYWLVPVDSLPDGDAVIAHIRVQERPKVVALVGYHDDAEAGSIAQRLPYGYRGDGVEEIGRGGHRAAAVRGRGRRARGLTGPQR